MFCIICADTSLEDVSGERERYFKFFAMINIISDDLDNQQVKWQHYYGWGI